MGRIVGLIIPAEAPGNVVPAPVTADDAAVTAAPSEAPVKETKPKKSGKSKTA